MTESSSCPPKKMEEVVDLPDTKSIERPGKLNLSEEEWRSKLTKEQYEVARNEGTEEAFSGELLDVKDDGIYKCACCGVDLFDSSSKFDSGSGWPSFDRVLQDKDLDSALPVVDNKLDPSEGRRRTEVTCGKCGAHLGHVFPDGPTPTGHRYCINSVCLKFKPEKEDSDNKS